MTAPITFGICNEIMKDWSLDQTFRFAHQVGYDFVEIAPFTIARSVNEISGAARAQIRDSCARAQIAISGLHWVLVGVEGLHLTHPDSAVRRATSSYFVDLVQCCADLGGTRLIVGSPKQRQILEGVTGEQAHDWAVECLRDAVACAEERDVIICFEPLSKVETNFVNTAAEAIRFAERFESPAMSVILDVKAMDSEPESLPTIIRQSAGKFAYFHANDPNLKGPGFGAMDFAPIVEALNEVNYRGTVSVEVFNFEGGPELIARQSLEYLRRVFHPNPANSLPPLSSP